MAKVRFTSKVNGDFQMQVEGAPGQQCLKITDSMQSILNKIKAEAGTPEPTSEMYASVSKDPEAFNNTSV